MSNVKRFLRTLYYRSYIRWLALQWVKHVNLGDEVIHNGIVRKVTNGVHSGCWTLSNPRQELVPRTECRKRLTPKNLLHSYRSGVRFYEGYWLSIWVNKGIEPWVRACPIWPGEKK